MGAMREPRFEHGQCAAPQPVLGELFDFVVIED
jgi:hypothetical protein